MRLSRWTTYDYMTIIILIKTFDNKKTPRLCKSKGFINTHEF